MARWMRPPALAADRHRQAQLALPAGTVDVWRARLDDSPTASAWLSHDERERASRFRLDRDRVRWVTAHAALRGILGRYLAVAPEAVTLTTGDHDKPQLAPVHAAPGLRFNLSHASELALVAVTLGGPVGVDVEAVDRRDNLVEIARRVLDTGVVQTLERVPAAQQPAVFFPAWVRHEAAAKCRGSGLTDDPGSDDPVVVLDLDVGSGYCAAVAVTGPPGQVRSWDWAI